MEGERVAAGGRALVWVVTQREVYTAYGDSHKSNSGCCEFDKFA